MNLFSKTRKLKENWDLFCCLNRLNTTLFDRVKIVFIFFYFRFSRFFRFNFKVPIFIIFNKKKLGLYISAFSDLGILVDVFVKNEYSLIPETRPEIIFDIGANVGFSALYFSTLFPNAMIYCFEPNPSTFEVLKENTKSFPNIKIFNEGVGRSSIELPFYISSSSVSCSFRQRSPKQSFIQIKLRSLDDIFKQERISHISICKFDVEGFEDNVLSGLSSRDNVKIFIGEIHLDICEKPELWFDNYFRGLKIKKSYFSSARYLIQAY